MSANTHKRPPISIKSTSSTVVRWIVVLGLLAIYALMSASPATAAGSPTIAGAPALVLGQTVSSGWANQPVNGTSGGEFWKVAMTGGETLTIQISNGSPCSALNVSFYAPSVTDITLPITSDAASGSSPVVTFVAPSSGTWIVFVYESGACGAPRADAYNYLASITGQPATQPPSIDSFSSNCSGTLASSGGDCTLQWTVSNATTCSLSSSPDVLDGTQSVGCAASATNTKQVTFPANTGTSPVTYTFTLTAAGVPGTTPAVKQTTVTVSKPPSGTRPNSYGAFAFAPSDSIMEAYYGSSLGESTSIALSRCVNEGRRANSGPAHRRTHHYKGDCKIRATVRNGWIAFAAAWRYRDFGYPSPPWGTGTGSTVRAATDGAIAQCKRAVAQARRHGQRYDARTCKIRYRNADSDTLRGFTGGRRNSELVVVPSNPGVVDR